MKLLIDADVLVYEIAFGAQRTTYCIQGQSFCNAQLAKNYCEENELDYRALRKAGDITTSVEVLPESVCDMLYLKKISDIKQACGRPEATISLFLSGEGNFRETVATTKPYKGNRLDKPRPEHYQYVRELVLRDSRTHCIAGIEADDALSISQYAAKPFTTILCTIDKDLNMVAGLHYDWGKNIKYIVKEHDALHWFFIQCLTGDSTDNIPGLPNWGEVKAKAWLEGTRHSPREGWDAVVKAYSDYPLEYLTEQATLLWMQRTPDEMFSIKHFEDTYL